jgi:glycyl-tRNA synthetase beta chain
MRTAEARDRTFLLEIGTEEIPARMVDGALRDLRRGLVAALVEARLLEPQGGQQDAGVGLGTPRRLALLVPGLRPRQPDREVSVTGPPVRAAYDAAGGPTRAAEGFARAQGVAVTELRRISTPKGECVGLLRRETGRPAAEVLAEAAPRIVEAMSFPKMMRWGDGRYRFVRPVHSILALLDGEVVDLTILGVRSGRDSFGHRFSGQARVPIRRPGDYVETLRSNGVIVEVDERRRLIETGLLQAARRAGGRIAPPPGGGPEGDAELVGEVTHLVEWPAVIAGTFDTAFLELPQEILVTALRHHQKSFALVGADGRLLNTFLAIANCEADRSGAIRRGQEWVLRARLGDARFFWEEDRRQRLEARVAALERVTFHERLGSYDAKVRRIADLSGPIAAAFAAAGVAVDAVAAREAARLCKADLTTQMVNEFPELQGIVGGLYARRDDATPAVAGAIYQHYRPVAAQDPVPESAEGAVVSIADRIDTQAGIFLLGLVPTGSRDPYGLRRSVQGTCRILIEHGVGVSLASLIDRALTGYAGMVSGEGVDAAPARAALLEFYRGRQEYLGEEAGLRVDSVRAALAAGSDDPYETRLRMQALEAIREDPRFTVLAAAHKRIKNILKGQPPAVPRPDQLREEAERALERDRATAGAAVEAALRGRDHLGALRAIGQLAPPLDRFFEEVMVMSDDRAARESRLALLQEVAALFLKVGDFSEIVVEGATGTPAARRTR